MLEDAPLEETLGEKSLQHILQSMLRSIENSKGQIFDIYEEARNEVEISKRNLAEVKRQANEVIEEVDALEEQEQKEKQRLVQESSRFNDYSEDKIQQAYEAVKEIQVRLGIAREKERQLRQQRNQMELRLQRLRRTVVAAERLAMRISSMLSFLGSQISDVVAQNGRGVEEPLFKRRDYSGAGGGAFPCLAGNSRWPGTGDREPDVGGVDR